MSFLQVVIREVDQFRQVEKDVQEGTIESLSHAGGAIRKSAMQSIKNRIGKPGTNPSPSGTPPRTTRGQLRSSIFYSVDEADVFGGDSTVFIGPSERKMEGIGELHEFGGRFRKARYPERPYMRPALERIRPRLPDYWQDTIVI